MTYIPGGGGGGSGQVSTSGDVALSNPANGEVLMYDTSIAKWRNAVPANNKTALMKAVVVYNTATASYSSRPSGFGSVEWIGPVDPGTAAIDNDTWVKTA